MATQVDFNFDLMARLAKEAPAEFARRREELILSTIATFHSPEAGFRWQSEIDLVRACAAPGKPACLAIARQMTASLRKMSALLKEMQALIEPLAFTAGQAQAGPS